MRISYEQLNKIKQEHNVDKIWSYSQLSTYVEHDWLWYLRYLIKVKDVEDMNIYSLFGGKVHEIMEDYIEGKIEQKDMIVRFENIIDEWKMNHSDLQFPTEKSQNAYLANMRHYFKNTHYEFVDKRVSVEKFVLTKFKDSQGNPILFQGYIDLLVYNPSSDTFYVSDFKTSAKSSFSGKKLLESSRQLQLYAIGIHQMFRVPYDKIILRYDLQKYIEISFLQENGKWSKPTLKDRDGWVADYESRIYKALEKMEYDFFEANEMLEIAKLNNDLSNMPQEIQDRFRISQGFVDIQMTEELAKDLEEWAVSNVEEANRRSKADDLEKEFPEPNLDTGDNFYYNVLNKGYLKYHKGYQEKLELQNLAKQELDIDSLDDDELNDLFR